MTVTVRYVKRKVDTVNLNINKKWCLEGSPVQSVLLRGWDLNQSEDGMCTQILLTLAKPRRNGHFQNKWWGQWCNILLPIKIFLVWGLVKFCSHVLFTFYFVIKKKILQEDELCNPIIPYNFVHNFVHNFIFQFCELIISTQRWFRWFRHYLTIHQKPEIQHCQK